MKESNGFLKSVLTDAPKDQTNANMNFYWIILNLAFYSNDLYRFSSSNSFNKLLNNLVCETIKFEF